MGCGCSGGGQMAVAGKVGSSVRVFELCDEQTFEALVQDTGSNFANWTLDRRLRPSQSTGPRTSGGPGASCISVLMATGSS